MEQNKKLELTQNDIERLNREYFPCSYCKYFPAIGQELDQECKKSDACAICKKDHLIYLHTITHSFFKSMVCGNGLKLSCIMEHPELKDLLVMGWRTIHECCEYYRIRSFSQ